MERDSSSGFGVRSKIDSWFMGIGC
jgi:hypothetical protein